MDIDNHKEYKHRMGTKRVNLVEADGTPLKDKEVMVKQTKHKFLFGCAEFSVIPYANNEYEGYEKEIADERFRKFLDIFNYVTLPFYWQRYEPVKGQSDTERMKKAAKWLISKGCILKGHPLCWHTLTAPWLLDLCNDDILKAQIERINRDVKEFEGLIDIWDVINEVVIMPNFDKYDNGITRLCKELGRINIVKEMFDATKKANPNTTLLINDYNNSEAYEILIEGCLEAGVPIDAIGIQSHMHKGYWGVEKTNRVLERYSRFKLPIHFTENTLVSGQLMPSENKDANDFIPDSWPSTPEGEERQAREVVSHYRTLFANPMVESITWWDFLDGSWLGAPSGLIHKDSTAKPAYEELRKLIKDKWWTKSFQATTDEYGSINISGFLGEYEVVCGGKTYSFTLDKESESVTLVF